MSVMEVFKRTLCFWNLFQFASAFCLGAEVLEVIRPIDIDKFFEVDCLFCLYIAHSRLLCMWSCTEMTSEFISYISKL